MFSIKDKAVLIIGGTAGIGRAIAERFVEAGAQVIIVGRRDGGAIAQKIGATFLRADVADEEQVRKTFILAEKHFGKLNVLINNAGLENTGPTIEEQSSDELRHIFSLNMEGLYYGLKYGPQHMADGGSIINTASLAGLISIPGYSQYSASKAAVISLTKTSALELAPRHIRVNAVCPGPVLSDMCPEDHPEATLTVPLTPLGRIGQTDDVVGLYHFLAAPESAFITGQAITVDGGISAGISYGTLEKISA